MTFEQLKEVYQKCDGRHVYVRTKCLDRSQHQGRAKVIALNGSKVEIQPEGHKATVMAEPKTLSLWKSRMAQYHPQFKQTSTGEYPKGTVFYLVNEGMRRFWGKEFGSVNFDANACQYSSYRAVKISETKLNRKAFIHKWRAVTKDEAIVLNQLWNPYPLKEVAPPTIFAGPIKVLRADGEELKAAWQLFIEAGNKLIEELIKGRS
jgi:hypothetical protein